jgi:hypothetical protein
MTTYLGQPCPIIAPLIGRYFENGVVEVDKCGSNLVAALLLGQGHTCPPQQTVITLLSYH